MLRGLPESHSEACLGRGQRAGTVRREPVSDQRQIQLCNAVRQLQPQVLGSAAILRRDCRRLLVVGVARAAVYISRAYTDAELKAALSSNQHEAAQSVLAEHGTSTPKTRDQHDFYNELKAQEPRTVRAAAPAQGEDELQRRHG